MRHDLHRILLATFAAAFLAGCNSTEQALQPLPEDVSGTAGAVGQPGTASGRDAAFAGQKAEGANGSLRFTPVIGAPVTAVTPLSKQLATEARKRGIAVYGSTEPGGDFILKGYFSAENDGTKTTVFFVWDVIDPAGVRMHRIQGREVVPGPAEDAWTAVPADAMERIATRTFDEYEAWLASRKS